MIECGSVSIHVLGFFISNGRNNRIEETSSQNVGSNKLLPTVGRDCPLKSSEVNHSSSKYLFFQGYVGWAADTWTLGAVASPITTHIVLSISCNDSLPAHSLESRECLLVYL